MKRKNGLKTLALLSMGLLTLTSCGNKVPAEWKEGLKWTVDNTVETAYNALANEARKDTYRVLTSYLPNNWNTAKTFQKENGEILTNVVDGLLAVDTYNRIVPELATEVPSHENGRIKTVNDKYEIKFTIRDDANWVKNEGWGTDVVEKVKAEDFVTALKYNLDYSNASESSYMVYMFIDGASEYYQYTQLYYFGNQGFGVIDKDKFDSQTPEICKNNIGAVASPTSDCGAYIAAYPHPTKQQSEFKDWVSSSLEIAKEDIDKVASFSRVGVVANGQDLTYKLTAKQDYFLSVTTYTPFLPIPTEYYNSHKTTYGNTAKDILSCGAYVVDGSYRDGVSTDLILNKSLKYYGKDTVKNGRIHIKQASANHDSTTSREMFERNEIDGFTVLPDDKVGWEKYVTGKDGTGTLFEPVSEVAYSQESLGDGSTFAWMINTNRTTWQGSMFDSSSTNKYTETNETGNNLEVNPSSGLPTIVENTNIALTYSPKLRQAILTALDQPTYFKYRTNAFDSYQDRKTSVNSWTPHDFYTTSSQALTIIDEEYKSLTGNDYLDYLEEAYVNSQLIGQNGETKAATLVADGQPTLAKLLASDQKTTREYGYTLLSAAEKVFKQQYIGGLALIPEVKDGAFVGWKKAAEGTNYTTATGSSEGKGGFGTGAVLEAGSEEGGSEQWLANASRDTATLSNLIKEGIAEAQANYKKETGIDYKIKTPIVIEYPTLEYSTDMNKEASATLNATNANLNGGKYIRPDEDGYQQRDIGVGSEILSDKNKTIDAKDAQVLLIHSTQANVPDGNAYSRIASTYNYNLVISGWGPDYADPKTYADTLKTNGDMQQALGTGTNGETTRENIVTKYVTFGYDDLVNKADSMVEDNDRARAYAEAEIHMLYENYLIKPTYMMGQGYNVTVRRTINRGVTSLSWGLSSYKYKGIEVLNRTLTAKEAKDIYGQLQTLRKNHQLI